MSDSEELLFGKITDAEVNNNNKNKNNSNNGTSYPQHLTTVAIDSDESDSDSDSYAPATTTHTPSQSKKSKSKSKSKLMSKIKRDKSRKRIKEMAMNETATNININNTNKTNSIGSIGEINEETNDNNNNNNNNVNKKNKKNKIRNLLNGKLKKQKKKNKKHHRISVEDSDDEYENDSEDNNSPSNNNNNMENISNVNNISNISKILISKGHLISIILTIIVIITLLSCISSKPVAIIIFIICYGLYLLECYFNKTWKQMNNNNSQIYDGNIKLLDALRKTPPIIDWSVECYHYEIKNIPITEKRNIIWVHGEAENGYSLEEAGFIIKYFKWDWKALEYINNISNQKKIICIILPVGYEGNRIQKGMISKFNENNSEKIIVNDCDDEKVAIQINDSYDEYNVNNNNMPLFLRWNGNMCQLLNEFKDRNIIREEKKKIITHTNKMIYDYNKWDDVSNIYPNFNKYEIIKLNITKEYYLLNDETKYDFNQQKQEFLSLNNKDKFQTFHEHINIRGCKNSFTINNNKNKKPFWYTTYGYWIFSILLCTIYPRYKSATMYAVKNWKLIKSISV